MVARCRRRRSMHIRRIISSEPWSERQSANKDTTACKTAHERERGTEIGARHIRYRHRTALSSLLVVSMKRGIKLLRGGLRVKYDPEQMQFLSVPRLLRLTRRLPVCLSLYVNVSVCICFCICAVRLWRVITSNENSELQTILDEDASRASLRSAGIFIILEFTI